MPLHLRELIVCLFGYLYKAISFYDSARSHGTFSYEVFIRDAKIHDGTPLLQNNCTEYVEVDFITLTSHQVLAYHVQ